LLPRLPKGARVEHHPAMPYDAVPGFVEKLSQNSKVITSVPGF
jgi:hypothetical protein